MIICSMADVIAGILGCLFGIVLLVSGISEGWGIFMIVFSIILMFKPLWGDDKQVNTSKTSYPTSTTSVTNIEKVISDPKSEITTEPLTIHDFLEISSENGIIKAAVKERGVMTGMYFEMPSGIVGKYDNIITIPAKQYGDKHRELTYLSPERGILKKHVELGQFSYGTRTHLATDMLLFELDTNEEAFRQYETKLEIERQRQEEIKIEREKQLIADKLKEKERRRKLEKEVRQKLIEEGEIMPAAGRAPIPRDIVDAVYTRDGGRCVYCGSIENLQVDHIIPFSKGGADSIENLQILCQKCNIAKSNKIG
jgi:hypothetical protein